jgi:hypothetical protein
MAEIKILAIPGIGLMGGYQDVMPFLRHLLQQQV